MWEKAGRTKSPEPALALNPFLIGTAAPPIPEAKRWVEAYDGAHGPLIDLSQAVPGYPPHAALLERLGAAAATREAARYGDILGDGELRAVYADHAAALYGARVGPDNVAIATGCNQAFFVAMLALAKSGDAVILPSPWYFNHKMTLDMLGVEAIPLPCRAQKGFVPDVGEASQLIDARVRGVVLVTPNNPTGAIYPAATIRAFHEACAARNVTLIVDETYRDFIDPALPRPHDYLASPEWPETLIQLYSFSKAYCIPGHRAGAMIAAPGVIAEIAKIMDTLQICAPRLPQLVLPWAIEALSEWRAENRDEIVARGEAFRAAMTRLDGWKVAALGAYLAYVEHPFPGRSGAEVAERLAGERGVLALPGAFFGAGQHRYIRFAFGNVDRESLAELPARMNIAYAETRSGTRLGEGGGRRGLGL
jgi:aspartate/methionine/tyrosine aminotransferase